MHLQLWRLTRTLLNIAECSTVIRTDGSPPAEDGGEELHDPGQETPRGLGIESEEDRELSGV